jgi:hypothetical protein
VRNKQVGECTLDMAYSHINVALHAVASVLIWD